MNAALWAEAVKLAGSTVGRVGSLAIVVGISVLSGTMLVAASTNDPQLLAKLGPVADGDWNGFLLGRGADHRRRRARRLRCCSRVDVRARIRRRHDHRAVRPPCPSIHDRAGETACVRRLGDRDEHPARDRPAGGRNPRRARSRSIRRRGAPCHVRVALGIMSAAITVPVAWAATLSRSVLGGVSVAIGLVVVAQVSVLVGIGGWMPLAAPALWAISAGAAVTPGAVASGRFPSSPSPCSSRRHPGERCSSTGEDGSSAGLGRFRFGRRLLCVQMVAVLPRLSCADL